MTSWSKEQKLFVFFFILYCLFANYDSWNENSRMDLTRAIVDKQTIIIDNFHNNTGDLTFSNGHFYTDKAPGSSILAIPAYLFYKLVFVNMFGFPIEGPHGFHPLLMFLVICSTSALFSALTVVIVYKVSKYFLSSEKSRNLTVVAYGVGTIAFSQATLFLGHAIAAFFMFYSFYFILKSRREKQDNYFLSGLFAGMAFFTDYLSIFAITCCFLYIILNKTKHNPKNVAKFLSGTAIFVLILLLYNQLAFSNPLSFSLPNLDKTSFSQSYLRLDESAVTELHSSLLERSLRNIVVLAHPFDINYSYNYTLGYSTYAENNVNEYFKLINSTYVTSNLSKGAYWLSFYHLKRGDFYEKIVLDNFNQSFKNFSVYHSRNQSSWQLSGYYYETNNEFILIDVERNLKTETTCPYYIILQNVSRLTDFSNINNCYTRYRVLSTNKIISEEKNEIDLTFSESFNDAVYFNIKYPETSDVFILLNSFSNILLRLLFDPFRGFFIYSPVLLLAFIGLVTMRKKEKSLSIVIMLIFLLLLVSNASHNFWWAGTTFGSRYLLLSIPFLSIPLGISIEKLNKKIVIPLLILSLLINFMGMQKLLFDQSAIFSRGVAIYNFDFYYRIQNWKLIANPLLSYYLPEFLHHGPRSVLIEEFLGMRLFPFVNILILIALLFIIKPFKNK